MQTREQDAVYRLRIADTHDSLLVFTNRGKVYQLRCHEVPDASRQGRGLPLVQMVNLTPGEMVTEILRVEDFSRADYLIMATRMGEVKKTPLSDFAQVRSSGLIATDLEPSDELVAARVAKVGEDLILVSAQAQAVRFSVDTLRTASRQSGGVKGMKLAAGDYLVAMDVVIPGAELLVISAHGYGKRTPLAEFPSHARGGSGVIAMRSTDRNGPVVAARVVWPLQELLLISQKGTVLRTSVQSVSRVSRVTQGVTVMRILSGDRVVSVACFNGSYGDGATQIELPSGGDGTRSSARKPKDTPST